MLKPVTPPAIDTVHAQSTVLKKGSTHANTSCAHGSDAVDAPLKECNDASPASYALPATDINSSSDYLMSPSSLSDGNKTDHISEQPINTLEDLLNPPNEVLRKIHDAKLEVHKLAANENNNLVQAQAITSDLLSSDVEVTRLVRRIVIKPEVIKSTYSKFVRPGTRRHVYPDVNYSRVLLRNKYQPLADLISDSILDDETSDEDDAESDNTCISETKSISHASRVSRRSTRNRKKRQRSYEPPPDLQSVVSGSTQSQRIRSHSTKAKQNRRSAIRRIRHSIMRMENTEIALYLHLHGVNDKAKQFFGECKPFLKLDASEFDLGKIEDPIQWFSRCVYANERCDVALEKFIQLYYLKSNRPVPWTRMLASAERINGKP